MNLARARIARLLETARYRDRGVLLETEGMALLEALGIAVPRRIEFATPEALPEWDPPPLHGERVVLKAVGPDLLHKTDLGAITVLLNQREDVRAEALAMTRRLADRRLDGFVLYEYVAHESALGHELLVGLRWTDAFGPVVTVGPGGIHAEFLARAFRPGEGLAVLAPGLPTPDELYEALVTLTPVRLVTERRRGRPARIALARLVDVAQAFLALAEEFCPDPIGEFEINPIVVSDGRLVALDALLKFSGPMAAEAPERPRHKLRHLLEPRSIALIGVSEKMNPGRIILQNTLRAGFDPAAITVVKPGLEAIDGCRCVPSLEALPERVDLCVLSLAAVPAAEALTAIAEGERAESVILIPSGL
ncbi:MAG TPA: acetate--CoA ligase family protein, partial [Dongiaceae bacterium]|nr:acetate--CoA ligase family protein [Dongiaceae bacterium]